MKKTLLLSILASLLMSFLFSECHFCRGGNQDQIVNYGNFWATLKIKNSKFPIIGYYGIFPTDSITFSDLEGKPLGSEFSIDKYGVIHYFCVTEPNIETDKSYSGGILVKFPVIVPWNPFSGVTDTIRFNYHVYDDKCYGPALDDFKLYYNDSLYYQGTRPNQHFDFTK